MDKNKKNNQAIDGERRQFLVKTTVALGAVGLASASIPFLSAWSPSAKAQADAAPVEADISQLAVGRQMIVEWRGKPVWIIRRSPKVIADLEKFDHFKDKLRDPLSDVEQQPLYARNNFRSIHPEYLILVGICTHLGCSPKYQADQFFCPCHGSTFDMAGRVYKNVPAPINLEVPPHTFINEKTVLIGVDHTPTKNTEIV